MDVKPHKKLIEVALPLPEINDASAYDKMPGIGPHPKGIHHWWARLPLPTARAVLFASVVDDPAEHPEKWPTEEAQNAERERLFDIIRRMMGKRLHEHPEVYAEARAEMLRHSDGELPQVLDPFSGGGSIPLEAQRLGLPTHASDLNPVAVLISRALLEIAPAWTARPPVHPARHQGSLLASSWSGVAGLAADIRHYSERVLERARGLLQPLYPTGPGNGRAVAWLWCRTVASPDPALRGVHVPLLRSLQLSTKKSGGLWVEPVVDRHKREWYFAITDKKPSIAATVGRRGGRCILSDAPIPLDYIRSEGRAGRLGIHATAVVGDGRSYIAARDWPEVPTIPENESVAMEEMPHNPFAVRPPLYGLMRFRDVFTPRQLYALTVFSDLIRESRETIRRDALAALGESDASGYADTVVTFLAFALDRCVDFNNSLCRWSPSNEKVMNTFGRPAIPMIWDFAEANILGDSVGSWKTCSEYITTCLEQAVIGTESVGRVDHTDAQESARRSRNVIVSTDPPYYNNVDYSDLSDFFYIWLRRCLIEIYPSLFSTVLTPKSQELVASPYRFSGNKRAARDHFEGGFREVFVGLKDHLDYRFPMTVYYAFKQADEDVDNDGVESATDLTTGWETLLEALIGSGFQISGTWPVRASQRWRQMSMGMNALASYIVLACRPRPTDAPQTDRRSFVAELRQELPVALRHLQQGNIAPVDFAQAAIGPGMAVYSRYGRILETNGKAMTVRAALSLINQTLTEVLTQEDDEFDTATQWALAWFDQHGFAAGTFGDAELLSKAKVTSVGGLDQAGIISARAGEVRLLRPDELPADWNPSSDRRLTTWEMTHHLLRVYFHEKAGDEATSVLLRKLGSHGEIARDLAYRLFNVCEKRKWSQEAQAYNALVLGWPEISRLAREVSQTILEQAAMFGRE